MPKVTQQVQENILLFKELHLRLKRSLRRLKVKENILIIEKQKSVLSTSIYAPAYYRVLGTSPNKGGGSIIYPALLYSIIGYKDEI